MNKMHAHKMEYILIKTLILIYVKQISVILKDIIISINMITTILIVYKIVKHHLIIIMLHNTNKF